MTTIYQVKVEFTECNMRNWDDYKIIYLRHDADGNVTYWGILCEGEPQRKEVGQ